MIQKELTKSDFDTVVRWIKKSDIERLQQLSTVLVKTLERLGHPRRPRNVVRGVPEGSDHFDSGSFIEWLGTVQPKDKDAVEQVVSFDATVRNRLVG